ncbi:helix-turn-helix transcriptional regulator [Permianibacter sp. IMCC34836]|uniref:helix-turn-helix domain-containing protein n=1 Tax=Permianibacter fluminis TaxID=2738515 RepID=UPI0015542AB4|nr:AraC family transcriptional regulator [Permianibacter fluminis]NQD36745.1 helix-turn-helix transcriptional regulator [Permianibacter fluminis]
MDIRLLQGAVVLTALGLLLLQVTVRQKQTVHLVFAVFCGSMAMMMAKRLGADTLGPYQYLLGLGACATCNGYWLVARALFREQHAVAGRHLLIAGSVALLLMSDQGITLLSSLHQAPESTWLPVQSALNALMGLLSSCLLVLAFWEGARGWTSANRTDRLQRMIFLLCYGVSVLSTTVVKAIAPAITDPQAHSTLNEIAIALASLLMLLVTQVLIRWRHPARAASPHSINVCPPESTVSFSEPITNDSVQPVSEPAVNDAEQSLAEHIHRALREQQRYLETELKVADLARQFEVSEYRISRAIHNHLGARNFNQLINSLRVEHAKTLLADPAKQHWPVLVVGLESGFASVGPFTRAFKAMAGCTPGEYRKAMQAKPLMTSTVNA